MIRNSYRKQASHFGSLFWRITNSTFIKDLTAFIHILEERLYHIDRQDIHEYTEGSDDGFLYCRCFVVGMGWEYYTMVDEDLSKATMDIEAELFGFSTYGVYGEKNGDEFERYSIHSIETCSNREGWQEE
jgi:hypothetical protein